MKWSLKLNDIRVRDKMLILYIFSVFIPIVLTNIIFYQVTTNNVKNQRIQDISRAMEQIKNEFRSEIEDAVTVSSTFYTDININEILETEYIHPAEYIEAYDNYFRRILNNYTPMYNTVQSIKIYVDNPTLLHSGGIGYLTDETKRSDWYQALLSSKSSQPILIRTYKEDNYLIGSIESTKKDTYSIILRLDYYNSINKWEKIIKIDLKISAIQQIFSNLNLRGNVYLLNDLDTIEYSTDSEINWLQEKISYSALQFPRDIITFETNYATTGYLKGWKIIGTVSEEEVFSEVRKSREFIMILACINIVLATLIILWITRSFNARLVNIVRHMKKVKSQTFETIKHGESRDEIGQLTREFNRMSMQIKSLIDDVYVADIQKKSLEIEHRQAQLNALQSQINPHFLFNALETIRMRSLIKNEVETAKIIHNMAKIFRTSLTWSQDRITVDEEMAFILCFLEFQKYRFEDRLSYQIHIDPNVKDKIIPKMTFLPFVENASIHGIEPLKYGGVIDIRIEQENDDLIFSINDNGVGMKEEKVNQFYSYLESENVIGERIGVQNVIYRLKLIYGDKFSFWINSKQNQGTSIVIKIPLTTSKS